MLRNFIVMATFLLMFNGYIWISLFDGYRDYWIQTIDSLEDDRVRLQLKIDELENGVKLEGLDVVLQCITQHEAKQILHQIF